MDVVELIKQFGFPIAVAVYMIWDKGRTEKEHKQDLRELAANAIHALDAGTEALNQQAEQTVRINTALEENNDIINQLKGMLNAQGNNNGGGS